MSGITLTGWDVLDEARATLRVAVAGVPAGGWPRATRCQAWDVTQVLQHAALDQQAWAAALAATPGPGENPFAPSGPGRRAAGLRRPRAGRVGGRLDGDRQRRGGTDPAPPRRDDAGRRRGGVSSAGVSGDDHDCGSLRAL